MGGMRVASMVMLLLLVGVLYERAKDPRMWHWLDGDAPAVVVDGDNPAATGDAASAPISPEEVDTGEVLFPGPTGLDPEQRELVRNEFDVLADNSPLVSYEMFAYWRCLRWANAESFADLARRARTDVPMTSLYEEPARFRGELLRLRLNISRVLEYEAPENEGGITKVYEAWGTTEESKSYPYVVVFSKLPKGLKVGTDSRGRYIFVGYFIKGMAYTAFDKRRSAPLLVGRMQPAPPPVAAPPAFDPKWMVLGILGGLLLAGGFGWWFRSRALKRPRVEVPIADGDAAAFSDWLTTSGDLSDAEAPPESPANWPVTGAASPDAPPNLFAVESAPDNMRAASGHPSDKQSVDHTDASSSEERRQT